MQNLQYICPFCSAHLLLSNAIILAFEVRNPLRRGILLLNPNPGNYEFKVHSSILFQKNELVDIYCPVCVRNLQAEEVNQYLAFIHCIDEKQKKYAVYFSRLAGEQATYLVHDNCIVEKYGIHANNYIGYAPDKIKKQTEDLANHYF